MKRGVVIWSTSLPKGRRCTLSGVRPGSFTGGAIWIKLDESNLVARKEVERTAKRRAHRSYRDANCRGPQQTGKAFRLHNHEIPFEQIAPVSVGKNQIDGKGEGRAGSGAFTIAPTP